eukprot:scaffold133415_cov14-Tisochrysis_lutea.AAC.1
MGRLWPGRLGNVFRPANSPEPLDTPLRGTMQSRLFGPQTTPSGILSNNIAEGTHIIPNAEAPVKRAREQMSSSWMRQQRRDTACVTNKNLPKK